MLERLPPAPLPRDHAPASPRLVLVRMQDKKHGVVFKLSIVSGRDIGAFSFYPRESEVLLSPNTRFVVARGMYVDDDGYSCVDLTESQGALLTS